MNAPRKDLEKRKAEAKRVADLLSHFRNSAESMKTALMEEVAEAVERVYPNLQGFCLEKDSPSAVLDLRVTLDFTPGAMGVKVKARVIPNT